MTQTQRPVFERISGGGERTNWPGFLSAKLEESLQAIETSFMDEVTDTGELRWQPYDVMYSDDGAYWALFADHSAGDVPDFQAWRALPGEESFGWVPFSHSGVVRMPATSHRDGYQVRQMVAESGERWNIVYARGGVFRQLLDRDGEVCDVAVVRRRPSVELGREALAEVVSLYPEPSIA
ncbi:MAG: hypothetical protein Q4A37_02645 [Candidatus Saccharibacteria bacterium]|nr:hypothetical protein [Candidatus Saccharibacteria bacterium]